MYSPRDTIAAPERLLDEVRDVRLVQQGALQSFLGSRKFKKKILNSIIERFNTRTFITKAKSYEHFESSQNTGPGATNSPVWTVPFSCPSKKRRLLTVFRDLVCKPSAKLGSLSSAPRPTARFFSHLFPQTHQPPRASTPIYSPIPPKQPRWRPSNPSPQTFNPLSQPSHPRVYKA